MKLIFKYMKPYLISILLIIGLTVAQVETELALPDYMSDIVTNGIQYGGITEQVPKAITSEDMERVCLFLSEDDKKIVLDNYDVVKADTTATISKQEIKFNKDTYILKNENEELAKIMQVPLVYAYIANQSNLNVNKDNVSEVIPIIEESIGGLKDNYSSMVKLHIQNNYANVGMNIEKIQSNYIIKTGLIMLAISFLSILVQLSSTYLATRNGAKISASLRKDIFEKIESFSSSEFSKFSTASLITRTGNDVTKIQQLCQMMMRMMLMAPIMGLTAVFKVAKYPSVSWLLLVAVGIMLGAMIFLLIVAVPKFEKVQKLVDKINGVMRESLEGMLVIRAFNSQKQVQEKFDNTNDELTKISLFVSHMIGVVGPIMTIIMNLLTVIIAWFAAKEINVDAMTIGDMMAFSQYAMHVVMSFMFVSISFVMIPRSLVSARRIQEIFDTKNVILDPKEPKQLPSENGKIVFDNVSFKYPGAEEYVLKNVCFEANPGETIALIGSTGSGKSTVVKLIPRLFDVSEGKITYCGIDIRDVKQEELHNKIGFATQKAVLFTGDIKSNVEFGRESSKEELDKALRVSQSLNILEEKEDGVNSIVTQGGTNFSGGQKQRLSIARALLKNEAIYIFDDSFSALDYETDKKLRKELNELIEKTKATVFIVAQRISTIKNADRILVFETGKIVGEGNHETLMKECEVYQQIAKSQLSQEELENARA